MSDCVFCKIIKKEIPNYTVYQDEHVLAFLDINPHAKGHTVVIPKQHVQTYVELEKEELGYLAFGVKNAMEAIQLRLHPDGFNVGWNHGQIAGQAVEHLHVHILPRYHGDGGGSMHTVVKNPGDVSVAEIAKLFV